VNSRPLVAALLAQVLLLSAARAQTTDAENAAGPASRGFLERFWENERVSGAWRSDYFQSSRELDGRKNLFGETVQLKMLPSVGEKIDGKLEARAINSAIGQDGSTSVHVLEAYGTYHFARADLRIGKQIVAWGRADGINPTDNLTPRDYTVMLPFEEDQRLGTPSARLDTFLSQTHTLTLYATPFFEAAKVPIPAGGSIVRESLPATSLANTAAGVKLNKVGEGLDWSVSYYRGFSLLPSARGLFTSPTSATLEIHHDRIRVFGADVARNYGRFGFRAEMAYIDTGSNGDDPARKLPFFYWVAGVDRTFFDNLNLNLQLFQRRARYFRDPQSFPDPGQRISAVLNSIIDVHPERVSNGMTFRIHDKWLNDTLEAEILAFINFTQTNHYIRPFVTYALSDRWKISVGGELYSGAPDTQFGSIKADQGAFAELRYGF
jgi:hypothetical protein